MTELPQTEERPRVELWSFDAISDDGADIVSIRFFSEYIFSRSTANAGPAVSFIYSANGEQVCRSVVEFTVESLAADSNGVSLGPNRFNRRSADYGSGHVVSVSLPLRHGKRLEAEFEWLQLDGDTTPAIRGSGCGDWNIESVRADVSGRLRLVRAVGDENVLHFRGTGSHAHYRSGAENGMDFGVRLAGSAHFVDSTVFFCREGKLLSEGTYASISLIGEAAAKETIAQSAEHYWTRTRYGIKYPRRFLLTTDDVKLRVKLMTPYESELCFARFPAEITMSLGDEKQRKAIGTVELLEPRRLGSKLVRWFSGLGVRKE